VAHRRQTRNAYRVWWISLRKGDNVESQGIHGSIILKWILTKQKWEVVGCFAWLMIVTSSRVL
jgi:hypothetical protein